MRPRAHDPSNQNPGDEPDRYGEKNGATRTGHDSEEMLALTDARVARCPEKRVAGDEAFIQPPIHGEPTDAQRAACVDQNCAGVTMG